MTETTPIAAEELQALRELAARMSASSSTDGALVRALFEGVSNGVLSCDADGALTLANRVARRWYGADPTGLPRSEWPRLYAADGRTPLARDASPLARALRGEEVVDARVSLVVRGQPVRHLLADAGRFADPEGRTLGALVVMRDVTELRRLEEELGQAREALAARTDEHTEELTQHHITLRAILDSVASPLFSIDRTYRYTSFNQAHAKVMAALYGTDVALGKSLLECMTVDKDRATARANLDRALAGEIHTEEALAGDDARSRQFFRVYHSPIRDGSGAVVGATALAQDLTDRRQAELALAGSERRFRDVFDNLLDGLHLLEVLDDGRYRTLEMNPAFERMTGISRADAVGRTIEEYVTPDVARIVVEKYARCAAEGRPIRETSVLDLAIGRKHFQSVIVPTPSADGRVHRLVGITRDVTEQHRQEAINAARLRLMQRAATSSLDTLLDEALDEAKALTGSQVAFFHFVGDDQRLLRLQSWSPPVVDERDGAIGKGRYYPTVEAERLAACIRNLEPTLFDGGGTALAPRLPEGQTALDRELLVPVLRGDKVRAIVGVANKGTDFSSEDISALRLIADLAWEIVDRKQAEAELARVNRSLRMLSDSNQALVRFTDETPLLEEVCRVIVTVGGYRVAWVGLPGPTGELEVRSWASDGHAPDHATDNGERDATLATGPAGEALRSGLPHLARREEGRIATGWERDTLRCQCAAVLAVPLVIDGRALGVLEVHAADPDAFDPEEVSILSELAVDLAFGITGLRTRTRRDEALAELDLSEQRYRELILRIHAAVVVHGPDSRILLFNPQAQRLLGLSEEQLAGREAADPCWHFVREDGTRMPLDEYPVSRVLATGEPFRGAVIGIHRPGDVELVWVLVSASPEREPDGTLTGVIVTFTDITERRRAERRLEDTAKLLNEAQRIAHIGSWELDLATNTLHWSKEIYRIFEISPSRFSASYEAFLDSIHPEDRERVDQAYQRSLQTREPYCIDHRLLLRHGRVKHVREQCETVFDGDTPLRSVGTVQDITEQKRAEEALRERESFIRNILDSVDEGFIVVDRDYRIIAANRAYCDSVGLPESAVAGYHCHDVAHSRPHPCFQSGESCPVWRTFQTGAAHRDAHVHVDPSGVEHHLELRSYPVTDAAGAVVSAIETISDVTERRRLEEQLHQAQKMEAIGTLAGGVAHDFNNLLTGIIGYGSVLRMELPDGDPRHASLDEILDAADRAAQLTHGLLAFSRKQIINPKPVDLRDVVRNVEKLLRRVIGEDVDLTTTLGGGELMVMADAGQIEQVLMNLATNARDAMPEGGRLSISVRAVELSGESADGHGDIASGRYAQLAVADSGSGMDDETRAKVFEPFFTTKEVGRGTGLGLAIVFGIIKQHGGHIDVQSEPGKGTTFTVVLPTIDVAVEEHRAEPKTAPPGGRETILLVEDDTTVRNLLGSVLTRFGYRVLEADDGADALATFAAHAREVDLLILDVVLPQLSGREVYDAIKAQRPDVHALFISGYTADIIHKKGILDEGLHFAPKPIDPFELLRRLRLILDEPTSS